ncbi:transposase, partial [Streptomyces sp. NRRL F-2664]|uniref:transposase n=1 Tax=Streptomyces sp. NRRL F-2664 TaxID=1463842 RepID=UPI003B63B9D5
MSDARWELVEPVLTAWRSERRGRGLDIGRPPDHDLRSLLDAVLYVNRTGIPWRYLPHDYPHWNTVYAYFARWQEEGVFDHLNSLLRRQVRRQEGREEEPTACVTDSRSIKTSTNVPACEQGIDAGKKIGLDRRPDPHRTGRRRPSHRPQGLGGRRLPPAPRRTRCHPRYRHAHRPPRPRHQGFAVLPRRWTVERTLGWLMNHRRLARDYEAKP